MITLFAFFVTVGTAWAARYIYQDMQSTFSKQRRARNRAILAR